MRTDAHENALDRKQEMRSRGVALILTLAMLLAVSVTLGTLMTSARHATRDEEWARLGLLADDLARASEPLVSDWLDRESHRAIVPVDRNEPSIQFMSKQWTSGSDLCSITLTAWDQLGMVPWGITSAHPLARSLSQEDKRALDINEFSLARFTDPAHPVYPTGQPDESRLGGRIATHRPQQLNQRNASNTPIININTAPVSLLRSALTLAQRTNFESIARARQQGEFTPAPPVRSRSGAFVTLTGSSPLWAVRADARVGTVTRSWWTVYGSTGGEWVILSRHEIAE